MRKEFLRMIGEGYDPVYDFTDFVDKYLKSYSSTREAANIVVEDILQQMTEERQAEAERQADLTIACENLQMNQ